MKGQNKYIEIGFKNEITPTNNNHTCSFEFSPSINLNNSTIKIGTSEKDYNQPNLVVTKEPTSIEDIKDKYKDILDSVTNSNVITAYFNLTSYEFSELTQANIYYIKELNGYFYINKATYKTNQLTELQLIKITSNE